MPMPGELSVPNVEGRPARSDNQDFLLIVAFCILGLTVSIFIASAGQAV